MRQTAIKIGAVLVLAVVVIALATQIRTQPGQSGSSAQELTFGSLPECAGNPTPVAIPTQFPNNFPLPPSTVVTSWEERSGNRIIVNGVAASDAHTVSLFLERELPKAAYIITDGESEPGESEAAFEGNGYQGRWLVRDVSGCPGAVNISFLIGY